MNPSFILKTCQITVKSTVYSEVTVRFGVLEQPVASEAFSDDLK